MTATQATAPSAATAQHGRVVARFGARAGAGAGGRAQTFVRTLERAAPLRVGATFSQPGGSLALCVQECSPGMLPGDSYRLEWHLEPGARVRIGTQSHQRVHGGGAARGSRSGAAPPQARHEQYAHVEPGAHLELLPEAVVLHAGASWESLLDVHVAAGATAIVAECGSVGRVEHGELLHFRRWRSLVRIACGGRPIVAAALDLEPARTDLAAQGLLGGATHWGALYVAGDVLDAPAWSAFATSMHARLDGAAGVEVSVDPLDAHGLSVLVRGMRAWDVARVLEAAASIARCALVQSPGGRPSGAIPTRATDTASEQAFHGGPVWGPSGLHDREGTPSGSQRT